MDKWMEDGWVDREMIGQTGGNEWWWWWLNQELRQRHQTYLYHLAWLACWAPQVIKAHSNLKQLEFEAHPSSNPVHLLPRNCKKSLGWLNPHNCFPFWSYIYYSTLLSEVKKGRQGGLHLYKVYNKAVTLLCFSSRSIEVKPGSIYS